MSCSVLNWIYDYVAVKRCNSPNILRGFRTTLRLLMRPVARPNKRLVSSLHQSSHVSCRLIDSLLEASDYVRTLERRQGLKVSVPEEVAWQQGWITDEQLAERGRTLLKSGYGTYLLEILEQRR